MSILRAFTPGRVIREGRNHFYVDASRAQKFAESDIVRSDPGYFRRVIDAPDDDTHSSRLTVALLRALHQLVRLSYGKKFIERVQPREIITVAAVQKSFLPNVDI